MATIISILATAWTIVATAVFIVVVSISSLVGLAVIIKNIALKPFKKKEKE